MSFAIRLIPSLAVLTVCFAGSQTFQTGEDIPQEFQVECGTTDDRNVGLLQVCDKRTQLCSDAVMLRCENCADDVCAFANGKDPVQTARQCRVLCPLYWEKLQARDFCDTCTDKCGTSQTTNSTTASADPERSRDDSQFGYGLLIAVVVLCIFLVPSLTANIVFVVLYWKEICTKLASVVDIRKRPRDEYVKVDLPGFENPVIDAGGETPEGTMEEPPPTSPQYTATNRENLGLAPGQLPHHADATHSPGLSSRHQFMNRGDPTSTEAS